jgi:hypothetical protein
MRHVVVRKTHVWDAESDRRLCEAVRKYGTECWSLGMATYSFHRAVSLTSAKSCEDCLRGRANKFLSEPVVSNSGSIDPQGKLDRRGGHSITTGS